jgi:hypothetical protein
MIRIGAPLNAALLCPDAFTWAVAPQRAGRLAVDLHQHGIVDIGTEGLLNRLLIWVVAITGQLHAVGQTKRQVTDEMVCSMCIARADKP